MLHAVLHTENPNCNCLQLYIWSLCYLFVNTVILSHDSSAADTQTQTLPVGSKPPRVTRVGSKYLWRPTTSNATLSCKMDGIPRPTVIWKLHSPDQPQLSFSLSSLSSKSHLLQPTQWHSTRNYTITSFLHVQLPEEPLEAIITCLADNGYKHHSGRKKRFFLTTGKVGKLSSLVFSNCQTGHQMRFLFSTSVPSCSQPLMWTRC